MNQAAIRDEGFIMSIDKRCLYTGCNFNIINHDLQLLYKGNYIDNNNQPTLTTKLNQ